MSERRIEQVVIAGSRDSTTVTISWDSRQALLERLRQADGADEIIRAFEALGTPVNLDKPAKRRLLRSAPAGSTK
jgi:hypothetical protein